MQIVIDISEDSYKATCDGCMLPPDVRNVVQGIKNGTPLPKGHGRLIDADAYIDKHEECGWLDDITIDSFNAIAPTIIEADKAESEDKCEITDGG